MTVRLILRYIYQHAMFLPRIIGAQLMLITLRLLVLSVLFIFRCLTVYIVICIVMLAYVMSGAEQFSCTECVLNVY